MLCIQQVQAGFKRQLVPETSGRPSAELQFKLCRESKHEYFNSQVTEGTRCSCTLVSGNELRLCSDLGFRPGTMVLNGNGKQAWEIAIAVNCGCLINVDSLFDLRRISKVCQDLGKSARVLIRVNPDIETNVHRYISTGTKGSKFGISTDSLNDVLEAIKGDNYIKLEGLHCHLGSTITDLNTFRKSSLFLYNLYLELKNGDFPEIHVINVGGGLGIAYNKHVSRTSVTTKDKSTRNIDTIPSPEEVVNVINDVIKDDDVTLILEPGRSLVADAAVFVSAVLGVKSSGETNYIVVDGSMTEVIRPALYQAYHHIDLAEPTTCEGGKQLYQIVGPVCESGDFLAKDRLLPTPHEGCCMALFDAGAYCASMASNYNMRPRRAEVMVDKMECILIRKPDTYEDLLEPYLVQEH